MDETKRPFSSIVESSNDISDIKDQDVSHPPIFDAVLHTSRMHETEPELVCWPNSEEGLYIDCPGAAYKAIMFAWRGGERLLRSLRILSPELTSRQKERTLKYFKKLNAFVWAYFGATNRHIEASAKSCRFTVTEIMMNFTAALAESSDYSSIIEAADTGFQARDAILECLEEEALGRGSINIEIEEVAQKMACKHRGATYVLLLAKGVKSNRLTQGAWAFGVIKRAKEGRGHHRPFLCAVCDYRNAKRVVSEREKQVRDFELQRKEFVAYHNNSMTGLLAHIFVPRCFR